MIKVIDTRPGAGKTSYAIQHMREMRKEDKIIYVTPFLAECDRILEACADRRFKTPEVRKGKGSKARHLLKLLERGENVVITHALFSAVTDEMLKCLRDYEYTLIMDEAMEVVTEVNLYELGDNRQKVLEDTKTLITKGFLEVNEDYTVHWTEKEGFLLHGYDILRDRADRKLLYHVGNTLLWCFPYDVFKEDYFKDVIVMTYLFEYQFQACYFKAFGIPYEKYYVEKQGERYELIPYGDRKVIDLEWRQEIGEHIHICEHDRLNEIGEFEYEPRFSKIALSKGWFERTEPANLMTLNRNVSNYFKNILKFPSKERMWTCFKNTRPYFAGNNELSKRNWVPATSRATNRYANKHALAYIINRYIHPMFVHFFARQGFKIGQDEFAISEFLQWMFRSAIRKGEDIYIYIPSRRMRELLEKWLRGGI